MRAPRIQLRARSVVVALLKDGEHLRCAAAGSGTLQTSVRVAQGPVTVVCVKFSASLFIVAITFSPPTTLPAEKGGKTVAPWFFFYFSASPYTNADTDICPKLLVCVHF
jgi:hypothetical protein